MGDAIDAALERAVAFGEVGVQVAVYHEGRLVVDKWIGVADEATGAPVTGDTLFPVFSVSKAFLATMIHVFVERGLLDLDAPIATYWPEFAANGKGTITIHHVLQHRAGLPQAPPWMSPERLDWDEAVTWIAAETPMAAPGERSQYHSMSFGFILGEVLRRVDPQHRSFHDLLHDEICGPLGIKDVWFGLPPSEEPRVAKLTWGPDGPGAPEVAPNPVRTAMMPALVAPSPEQWNLRALHTTGFPAASGIMTARDGARFFGMLANGGAMDERRFISRSTLLAQCEPRPDPTEVDEGIGMPTANGVGGYWVGDLHPIRHLVIRGSDHMLGHTGAGGSLGWADLDRNLGVVINHNRMFGAVADDRHPFVALGDAIRALA